MRTRQHLAAAVAGALALSLVTAGPAVANAPSGTPAWTKQFGTALDDRVNAVTMTSTGSVFVAGTTADTLSASGFGGNDPFVARFALDGRRVWLRQFGTAEHDEALAVASTAAGDVYVVGSTMGALGGPNAGGATNDAFVAKYDRSGRRKWLRQFGSTADDSATAVSVTRAGDVYVAGNTAGDITPTDDASPIGSTDLFLARFDRNGNRKWTRQIGSTAEDLVAGVAASHLGHVYVAGSTLGTLPGTTGLGARDGFVYHFDTLGDDTWVHQFGGDDIASEDAATSVAVTGDGDAIVAASVGAILGETYYGKSDAALLRLSTSGTRLWEDQFGTAEDDALLTVSLAGSVVVAAGRTSGSLARPVAGGTDIITTRYDLDGNRKWVDQQGSTTDDATHGVAVTSAGDIVTGGATSGDLAGEHAGTGNDAFVARYGRGSGTSWGAQWGSAGNDVLQAASLNRSGNVLVAGTTEGELSGGNEGGWDAYFARLDSRGNLIIDRQFGTELYDEATAVGAASNGDIYVAGHSDGTIGAAALGARDGFVARFDSSGEPIWTEQFGTSGNDEVGAATVTASGDVYAVGYTTGNLGGSLAGTTDGFLVRYDRNGDQRWARQVGATGTETILTAVAVSSNGDAYVAGFTTGSLADSATGERGDAFVAKYDRNGRRKWIHQYGTNRADGATSIAVNRRGEVYVAGFTEGALPGRTQVGLYDSFLLRLDRNGGQKWLRQFGASDTITAPEAVAVNDAGRVVVVGYTDGNLAGSNGGEDAFLAQFDRNGNQRRIAQYGSSASDAFLGVSLSSAGNAYAVGTTSGPWIADHDDRRDVVAFRISF